MYIQDGTEDFSRGHLNLKKIFYSLQITINPYPYVFLKIHWRLKLVKNHLFCLHYCSGRITDVSVFLRLVNLFFFFGNILDFFKFRRVVNKLLNVITHEVFTLLSRIGY